MTSAADVIAIVFEVLTWVGLVPGILLLVVGYARGAFASRFEKTWGVIIDSPAGSGHPWFRWMDLARELQSAPVDDDSGVNRTVGDEVEVYFDPRNPQNGRLDDPAGDGRLPRILGWVLTGVGIAAAVGQLIVVLVE